MLMHSISADAEVMGLGAASKLNADKQFLRRLHAGRRIRNGGLLQISTF